MTVSHNNEKQGSNMAAMVEVEDILASMRSARQSKKASSKQNQSILSDLDDTFEMPREDERQLVRKMEIGLSSLLQRSEHVENLWQSKRSRLDHAVSNVVHQRDNTWSNQVEELLDQTLMLEDQSSFHAKHAAELEAKVQAQAVEIQALSLSRIESQRQSQTLESLESALAHAHEQQTLLQTALLAEKTNHASQVAEMRSQSQHWREALAESKAAYLSLQTQVARDRVAVAELQQQRTILSNQASIVQQQTIEENEMLTSKVSSLVAELNAQLDKQQQTNQIHQQTLSQTHEAHQASMLEARDMWNDEKKAMAAEIVQLKKQLASVHNASMTTPRKVKRSPLKALSTQRLNNQRNILQSPVCPVGKPLLLSTVIEKENTISKNSVDSELFTESDRYHKLMAEVTRLKRTLADEQLAHKATSEAYQAARDRLRIVEEELLTLQNEQCSSEDWAEIDALTRELLASPVK